MLDQEDMVGGERTTRASTASSLNLRRAFARRPLSLGIMHHSRCIPLQPVHSHSLPLQQFLTSCSLPL
jgi:hypothetical protein